MNFLEIVQYVSGVSVIFGFLAMLIKPIRERLPIVKAYNNGWKSMLRADMLKTYYAHKESGEIRQYEYENFIFEYEAYKARGGNSFIDKIYDEVKEWELII